MKRFLSLFIAALACQAMLAQAVIKFDKTVSTLATLKKTKCKLVSSSLPIRATSLLLFNKLMQPAVALSLLLLKPPLDQVSRE